jgi:hypothetical protein
VIGNKHDGSKMSAAETLVLGATSAGPVPVQQRTQLAKGMTHCTLSGVKTELGVECKFVDGKRLNQLPWALALRLATTKAETTSLLSLLLLIITTDRGIMRVTGIFNCGSKSTLMLMANES